MEHSPQNVIVVGGGIAGLATALHLAPLPVTLVVASPLGHGAATGWAQGGIAAALGADDRADLHAIDTLAAGAGLSEPHVARRVANAAPEAIDWLAGLGAPFDRDESGSLALGLEAAHSRRRIVHADGDGTGRAVLETLVRAVRECPSIHVLEGRRAGALLRARSGRIAGLCAYDREGRSLMLAARAVVLATGGIGGLYASTTNPLGATGSGLALAARAGARLRDMEFVQFHPTAMAVGADPMPLATEALRGEGAVLVNDLGERFMASVTGQELAPRDVVARAIFAQIADGRRVMLDARLKGLETRFPGVVALCRANGLDPIHAPIPVRPAAHYHMGGIEVDDTGRSSVPGLWACGEVSSTGLHGANRLASNSLLEALAYGRWIAVDIAGEAFAGEALHTERASMPSPVSSPAPLPPEIRTRIRGLMDSNVGVVREACGLEEAVHQLGELTGAGMEAGTDFALVALMVAQAALERRESRGGHYRADHPLPSSQARHASLCITDLHPGLPERQADARQVA